MTDSDLTTIEANAVARLEFTLIDAEGNMLARTDPGAPWEFLVGGQQLDPALEKVLGGLRAGEVRDAVVPRQVMADSGEARKTEPEVFEMPRASFPADIAAGDLVLGRAEDGGPLPLRVREISDGAVKVDTDVCIFHVQVRAVRKARPEELAKGFPEGFEPGDDAGSSFSVGVPQRPAGPAALSKRGRRSSS